jgi:hypothetical protein
MYKVINPEIPGLNGNPGILGLRKKSGIRDCNPYRRIVNEDWCPLNQNSGDATAQKYSYSFM